MVIQNKIFSFKIKRQAKNVFLSDVERTVIYALTEVLNNPHTHCERKNMHAYLKKKRQQQQKHENTNIPKTLK